MQDEALQRETIQRWAQARGVELRWYHDTMSGRKDRRPGLQRLLQDACRGEVAGLVVWRFDRLARSTKHLLSILDQCRQWRVPLVSLTEAIDLSTPVGELAYTFIAAVAQFERALISERVKAGLTVARLRGVKLGRPKIAVSRWALETAQAKVLAGQSVSAVARELQIPYQTLRRHLAKNVSNRPPATGLSNQALGEH